MIQQRKKRTHLYLLTGLFLGLTSIGTWFSLSGGASVSVAIMQASFVAGFAFAILSLLYLSIVIGSPRQIRLFQALFVGLVTVMIGANLLGGEALSTAVISGFFAGAINFIPVMILLSVLVIVHWFGNQPNHQAV